MTGSIQTSLLKRKKKKQKNKQQKTKTKKTQKKQKNNSSLRIWYRSTFSSLPFIYSIYKIII